MAASETGAAEAVALGYIGVDPEVRLLVPRHDVVEPELSIVIPALDEAVTVGDFVDWCREGLDAAGVVGEVIIVDSSSDQTSEIALEHGARVLRTPRRGLGRAYIDALPYVRGEYILMGDADCTYDFRLLSGFVEKLREGYEFVMGSRWAGSIEPGSMPWLHQYLGTPVTTWILNLLYGSRFSDIHCGMRGDLARRLRAHEPRVAVLGVRVRDGAEVGAHGSAHCRGSRPLPQGSRRAREPPQARRLDRALEGGLDQPARDVRLRRRLLRPEAGPRAPRARAPVDDPVRASGRSRSAR